MIKKIIKLLAGSTLLTIVSAANAQQPWSNILSPGRATNWTTAGLPLTVTYGTGGTSCPNGTVNCVETNLNPWTPATRTQTGSTITCANTAADPATINAALAAAFPGQFVLIGPGTCAINANIVMANGVSLRGSGAQSTTLNITGASTLFTFGSCCGGIQSGVLSASSYAAGTTSVTITGAPCGASCPELTVGNVAYFEQCDTGWTGTGTSGATDPSCTSGSYVDPLGPWVCGIDYPECSSNSSGGGGHFYLRQPVVITGVVNNGGGSYTVTFSPGFDFPLWSSSNNAQLFWVPRSTNSFGAGIENLTLNFSFNTSESLGASGYAWRIKGNRIIGFPAATDVSITGVNGLFSNNYVFGQNADKLNTNTSEPIVTALSGSSLILNNLVHGGNCVWGNGRSSHNVNAYNYCRDSATGFSTAILLTHNPFESCRLDEGNSLSQIQYDNTHGTGDFCDTAFRNHVNMNDPPYTTYISTNPRGITIDNFHRVVNLVGNVTESHGPNTQGAMAYQGTTAAAGDIYLIPSTDQLAQASLLRFANYDSITGAVRNCVPGFSGFTSAPCNGSSATGLAASESGSTVTVTSTLNPGTAIPTIVTMTACSVSGYNGMFQVTSSNGSSFQYVDYANSGMGAATGCTATLGSEVPTILAGANLSAFNNLSPANATMPCSFFLTGYTSTTCAPFPSGGTGLSWWKVCTAFSSFPTACSATSVSPFPAIGPDVTGGSYAGGHAYATPAELAFSSLPIDTGLQNTFSITGSSWTSGTETLTVSMSTINNGSNEHIMGGFQLSGVNAACIPSGLPANNEILMTGSSTTTVQYALTVNPGVSCTGSLLFPNIRKFDERVYVADPAPPTAPTAPATVMFAKKGH